MGWGRGAEVPKLAHRQKKETTGLALYFESCFLLSVLQTHLLL